MTPRATWKGTLAISLVRVPIKVFPATDSSPPISFNQLHAACQTRISQPRHCTRCGRDVPASEIVKAFEFAAGRYVPMSEADFAKVQPPSTHVIDLVQVALARTLDPVAIERSFFVQPDGDGEAFAVMREALKGLVGIGKVALYGREYLVAVRPRRGVLYLHTLHHGAEMRAVEATAADPGRPIVVTVSQLRLAKQVIDTFRRPLDLATYRDDYRAGLQAIIDAKIAGQEIVTPPAAKPRTLQLMEALTASLAAVQGKPVKVSESRRKTSEPPAQATAAAAKRKAS